MGTWGIPNFPEISYWEFPFHLAFLLEFSEFPEFPRMVFLEIEQFLEIFPGNVCTICSCFEIFDRT